jgi:hypothetical protein
VQEFVHDGLKPGTATQPLVNQDAGPLGRLKERPPGRVTRETGETQQPPLAVNLDAVILGHGLRHPFSLA